MLVMDGDLQHPPETAAILASTAMRHDSDIVVGTRTAATEVLRRPRRHRPGLVLLGTTRLVKSMFPRRLVMVSDPLSGLFAFRRSAVNLDALHPDGFKILLELLVEQPGGPGRGGRVLLRPALCRESKASFHEDVPAPAPLPLAG